MAGTLYLVPTPIGNLGDISQRMADTLAEVDFIAAEDTRVTLKLLNHLELKKPLISYYRHNTEAGGQAVLGRLLAGESCALVTDAGTPAISDPGEDLVALCARNGVDVVAIPGPCALITALAVSGLPTGRFTFEGFLAMNKKNRRAHLESLAGERRTMLFYEAPHKLCATLEDLAAAFGPDRRIALCRELTKLHEEVRRTTLGQAVEWYAENPPRGEFVLVVEGAPEPEEQEITLEQGLARVEELRETGHSLRDAVKQTVKETGLPKNELYALAVGKEGC
ncbi:16S rRNA (cytidine(1402)-2'-O)-methyltransferase [Flavonifractor hominis]|uniref:Ribosomal RNA small subunit methyltransferase I n=1 Tax=Flavonifractor hominis TaxID=3133178 RepID=A0ABV1EQ54_9FIRM